MNHIKKFNESKKSEKLNYKKLIIDEFVVFQGKSADTNDYITLELSSPEDYWFHAKGYPGSHLLIKVKDQLPPDNVIQQVAELAAKNSKAPIGKVSVIWCKKKFVSKESKMNAGQVKVDYRNSNIIIVNKK